eukprot:425415_1
MGNIFNMAVNNAEMSNTIKQLPTERSKTLRQNSRIQLGKGRGCRYYNHVNNDVKAWAQNRQFEAGDVVMFNVSDRYRSKHRPLRSIHGGDKPKELDYETTGDNIDSKLYSYEYWAMCMKQHISNSHNKLTIEQIFNDLVVNIASDIKYILIDYVSGFNDELSHIIISYCYSTNEFWWSGCRKNNKSNVISWGGQKCGNLSYGTNSTKCKLCLMKNNTINKDIEHGTVIKLDKNTGNVSRVIDKQFIVDSNNYKNVILETQITSSNKRQQIYNLLTRNFNNSMKRLIECCMNGQCMFEYVINDKQVMIDIGNDVYVWGLYNNMNEILCGLIWRKVNGVYTTQTWTFSSNTEKMNLLPHNFSMFEVLFLSTFENVRYEHYGEEMVKRIELYARQNCFDIISVAAVPGHGVGFWTRNGFEQIYDEKKCLCVERKNTRDKRWGLTISQQFDGWILKNMLVFDDTPLFAKYLC